MAEYEFETLDVFAAERFGGNPLAVLPDARGLTTAQMQAVAREFNLSETTFVLPPDDPAHDARVRIFTPAIELPFAGHPNVGTGHLLAARRGRTALVFEEGAGPVAVEVDGAVTRIRAPLPFTAGPEVDAHAVAAAGGLAAADIDTGAHRPIVGSCGTGFVLARVRPGALARAAGSLDGSRAMLAAQGGGAEAASAVLFYEAGDTVRARMFGPLVGVMEDPATGSAAVALGGLLLSLSGAERAESTVHQGVEMGRPSAMHVRAWRNGTAIMTSVGGACVRVSRGLITV